MGNPFARSWHLFKATWSVLRSDKELAMFPIISAVVVFIATILLLILAGVIILLVPGLREAITSDTEQGNQVATVAGVIYLFFYYLVTYSITNYLAAALIGAAFIRLDGGDPTLGDGFRAASARLGKIIGYSVIAATVGVLLSLLRGRQNNRGGAADVARQIAASLGEMAWNIITYLVIPVIVARDVGPIDAIKESGSLLRKTWGEQLIGGAGVGLIMVIPIILLTILGIFLAIVLANANMGWAALTVIVLVVVAIAILVTIANALSGIYKAALYRYAERGEVSPQFEPQLITGAFRPRAAGAY